MSVLGRRSPVLSPQFPFVGEKRLLVLGAGPAQLGLLAAARRLGVLVVAADRDPAAPGFRYAHRRALVSIEDEPGLDRLARAERVDGVIAPGSDRSLALAARVADKLGVPHPLRLETAHAAAARQRERELYASAGISQPEAVLCHSLAEARAAADRLGYPCVIRAVDRQDNGRVAAASSAAVAQALAVALARSRGNSCLVEELPLGRALTVTAFAVAGRIVPLLVSDDDPTGPSWPPSTGALLVAAAVDVVERAAIALGVDAGPITAQVVLRGDGPCLIRLAPRLGSAHEAELCRAAVGVDLHGLAVGAAVGVPVAAQEIVPSPLVGGACIRVLAAPADGRATIDGPAAAFALDGVRGIRVYRCREYAYGEGEPAAAVLTTGADREAALDAASRALGLIRFESVDAEALV